VASRKIARESAASSLGPPHQPIEPVRLLSVTLLGGFVFTRGHEVVDLPSGAQRLVALLALRGRTSRSRVAGTLWPDTTEQRALASLQTVIWRVNQTTTNLVTASTGMLDLEPSVDVDVRRLVPPAIAILTPTARGSVQDLRVVFEDDGELLPGWEDDWLVVDRERLRQVRLHVLESVAERLAQSGSYGLALEAALAALRADALRESAHRLVIRIHLAEGNVAEARRAYEQCRTLLLRDVGVEPSPAVRDLFRS